MNRGFFQSATFSIDDPKPKSSIDRKSNKKIRFSVLPKESGTVAAKYSVALSGFNYQKYISITFKVETIIGCSLDRSEHSGRCSTAAGMSTMRGFVRLETYLG